MIYSYNLSWSFSRIFPVTGNFISGFICQLVVLTFLIHWMQFIDREQNTVTNWLCFFMTFEYLAIVRMNYYAGYSCIPHTYGVILALFKLNFPFHQNHHTWIINYGSDHTGPASWLFCEKDIPCFYITPQVKNTHFLVTCWGYFSFIHYVVMKAKCVYCQMIIIMKMIHISWKFIILVVVDM